MEFAVRFLSTHLSPAPSHRAATLGALSTTSSFTLQLWTCWDLFASLAPPPSALLSGTKLWLIYIKYDSWTTCSFCCLFVQMPTWPLMIPTPLPASPCRWDPLPMTPNTTYNISSFFKIHSNTNIDVIFFLSHTNQHDHVLFIVHVFFMFFLLYVHTDVTSHCWNLGHSEHCTAFEQHTEEMESRNDGETRWGARVLDSFFFWNNTMHAHTLCVPSHRQPDYITQDFLSSTCSVLD